MSPSHACRLALAALVALIAGTSTLAQTNEDTNTVKFLYKAQPYWQPTKWDLKEDRYIHDGDCSTVIDPDPLAQPCVSGQLSAILVEGTNHGVLGVVANKPELDLYVPIVTVRRFGNCSGEMTVTVYGQCSIPDTLRNGFHPLQA